METRLKTQLEAFLEERLIEALTEICITIFKGDNVDNTV